MNHSNALPGEVPPLLLLSPCPHPRPRTHHVEDPQGHCRCLDVEAAAFGGLGAALGGHFRVPLSTPELTRPNLRPPHGKRSESSSASFLPSECVKSSTKSHEALGFLNRNESKTGGLLEDTQLGKQNPSAAQVPSTGLSGKEEQEQDVALSYKYPREQKQGQEFHLKLNPADFAAKHPSSSLWSRRSLPAEAAFPGSAAGAEAGGESLLGLPKNRGQRKKKTEKLRE